MVYRGRPRIAPSPGSTLRRSNEHHQLGESSNRSIFRRVRRSRKLTSAMPLCSDRKWGPNAKAVKHRYTREEVDFFLGYVAELDTVFVFPFDDTTQFKHQISVWLLRRPVGTNQH